MSEKLLRFLLTELETIRIICRRRDCGAVIELPVKSLEASSKSFKCPLCGAQIRTTENYEDLFDLLGRVIRKFKEPAVAENIAIEFVLPDKQV